MGYHSSPGLARLYLIWKEYGAVRKGDVPKDNQFCGARYLDDVCLASVFMDSKDSKGFYERAVAPLQLVWNDSEFLDSKICDLKLSFNNSKIRVKTKFWFNNLPLGTRYNAMGGLMSRCLERAFSPKGWRSDPLVSSVVEWWRERHKDEDAPPDLLLPFLSSWRCYEQMYDLSRGFSEGLLCRLMSISPKLESSNMETIIVIWHHFWDTRRGKKLLHCLLPEHESVRWALRSYTIGPVLCQAQY